MSVAILVLLVAILGLNVMQIFRDISHLKYLRAMIVMSGLDPKRAAKHLREHVELEDAE